MRLEAIRFIFILCMISALANCGQETDDGFSPPVVEPPDTEVPVVDMYLTTPNQTALFELQSNGINPVNESLENTITVNPVNEFQPIDGFGFALTGGSALHINSMSEGAKSALLNELFGNGSDDIGISFIRISIGSSDLDAEVFSYSETVDDQTHNNFTLEKDKDHLIPVLKEIIGINPEIKIMASPWSPPVWMKSNGSSVGGSLLTENYESYSMYLKMYIQQMEAEGINITHLTIQNEPLNPFNNPSLLMTATEQTDFIKNHLGPAFEAAAINTKIVIYDHNPDRIDYPTEVLEDEQAAKYIDGSAFHLYAGSIQALSTLRNRLPEKNIYFTEQWFEAGGSFSEDLKWHIREVVIGSMRNWSRSVIEWNLSSDLRFDPHTPGGCDDCLGGITINGDAVSRNAGYYVINHVSKLVPAGSVRIDSNMPNALPNAAFKTPDNMVILLVLNNTESLQSFNINEGKTAFSASLDPGAVATFQWPLN